MINKKNVAILISLILLATMGIGWLVTQSSVQESKTPQDNIHKRIRFFPDCENYLNRKIFTSPVHGTSMEPTFGEGDNILWVKIEPSELEVDDIIIYEHPTKGTKLIAHRIIDIEKDEEYRFETKGDSREKSDAKTQISAYRVEEDDLKGLVIGVIYSGNSQDSASVTSWSKVTSIGSIISMASGGWTKAESWRI